MMMTQNGKLLYISDNAAEYLGHSMVSVLQVSEPFEHISLRVSLIPLNFDTKCERTYVIILQMSVTSFLLI